MKNALLFILLIPCWIIAFHYHVDLVVVDQIIKLSQTDLSKIYLNSGTEAHFYYGPVTIVLYQLLLPFKSYHSLEVAWLVIQTAAYVLFWFSLQKLYPFLMEKQNWRIWLLVFLFALNPIHNNFQSGNIQLMLAAVLLFAEYLTYKKALNTDLVAGSLVALSAAVKVFPLFIVVYYLLVKSPRVWLGILVGAAIAVVSPYLIFGMDGGNTLFHGFWTNLFVYQEFNPFQVIPDILCLPSLLARLHLPKILANTILVLIPSTFLGFSLLKRKAAGNPDFSRHLFALALAVMTLINPSTRVHYFIFFVPAFCSLIELSAKISLSVLSVFALVALTTQGVVGKTLNDKLEFWSLPTWGFVLLVVATVVSLRNFAKCQTSASSKLSS